MSAAPAVRRRVVMGKIGSPCGLKGWVRVFSTAEPPESIFEYASWQLGRRDAWSQWSVRQWRPQGVGFAAQLCSADGWVPAQRDEAARLTHHEIALWRDELPEPEPGEYYWADLVGLEVVTETGQPLGQVASVFATGANDVLVVSAEHGQEQLLPFVQGPVVKQVDLAAGRMTVAWDADF